MVQVNPRVRRSVRRRTEREGRPGVGPALPLLRTSGAPPGAPDMHPPSPAVAPRRATGPARPPRALPGQTVIMGGENGYRAVTTRPDEGTARDDPRACPVRPDGHGVS